MTRFVSLMVDTRSLFYTVAFIIVSLYMLIFATLFIYLYAIKFSFKEYIWHKRRKTGHILLNLFWIVMPPTLKDILVSACPSVCVCVGGGGGIEISS